jgi:hypothetical protein
MHPLPTSRPPSRSQGWYGRHGGDLRRYPVDGETRTRVHSVHRPYDGHQSCQMEKRNFTHGDLPVLGMEKSPETERRIDVEEAETA